MKKLFTLLSSLLLFAGIALAQPGALDHTFNAGFNFLPEAQSAGVTNIVALPDGKAFVAGSFFIGGNGRSLIRINQDGTLDNSFINTLGNLGMIDMKVQTDGKILVVTSNGDGDGYTLIRLNDDGSLDAGFNATLATNSMMKVNVQSDGKILLIAYNTGDTGNKLYRINTDGSQDMSFGTGGFVQLAGNNIMAVQEDDKIIMNTYNGNSTGLLIRLDANGNPDAGFDFSFNSYNGTSGQGIEKIIVQADGKILIAGNFVFGDINNPSSLHYSGLARLNTDGSIDNSFIDASILTTYAPGEFEFNIITTAYQQPDGKIYVSGQTFYESQNITKSHLIRLNSDGSRDVVFTGGDGVVLQGTNTQEIVVSVIKAITQLPNGKIIAGGFFGYSNNYNGATINSLARLKDNGSLDNGAGANGSVRTSCVQADGKLIIGGDFTSYNGISINHIAKVNVDGSVAESFHPGSGFNNVYPGFHDQDVVHASVVQSDGKILVGGYFPSYNGIARNGIVRLNANGSIDAGFDPGTGAALTGQPGGGVLTIVLQTDGKILVGGEFTSFNGTACNGMVRLNTDGSVDPLFVSGIETGSIVKTISIQGDGKIIAGGTGMGTAFKNIARLNTDGSIDPAFNRGIMKQVNQDPITHTFIYRSGTVFATSIQPDGKIFIAGIFNMYDNLQRTSIARLNADGTIDPTFFVAQVPIGTSGALLNIYSVVLQPDGKLILGGTGADFEGSHSGIVRVLNDGTIDNSFVADGLVLDIYSSTNDAIYTMLQQTDGKVIIGGSFTTYNGVSTNYLARILTACSSTVTSLSITASPSGSICTSTPVTFTAVPVNGGSSPTYQWQKNGLNVGTNTNTYNNSTWVDGDIVTCALTSSSVCASPATVSSSLTMSVLNTPVTTSVSIAITSGSNPVCAGESLTFTATPVNGGSNPFYQWTITNYTSTINVGTNSPTFTYNAFNIYDVVRCTLTSNAPCATNLNAVSNSIQVNVTTTYWYLDADGDNYSTGSPVISCTSPGPGYTTLGIASGDCDDNNRDVHPNATEIPGNGIDDNCNGQIDEITYCTPNFNNAFGNIQNVNLGDLHNLNTGYGLDGNAYSDYSTLSTSVSAGNNISYDIATGGSNNNNQQVSIYIDYNNNGSFDDAGEQVVSNQLIATGNNATGSFTVASTQAAGNYRIRIITSAHINGNPVNTDPCFTNFGEAEDYTLIVTPFIAPTYCVPSIQYPCTNTWLENVTLGTITNNSTGCNGGYSDYSANPATSALPGETVAFSLTGNFGFDQIANIYVDFNNDQDFDDAGEAVATRVSIPFNGDGTGTFMIPITQPAGNYRLRIVTELDNSNVPDPTACHTSQGEVEDYTIQILPVYCTPVIDNPCSSSNINYVHIGSIYNYTGCSGYDDYSATQTTTESQGATVNFNIGTAFGYGQNISIYIDYNSDGDFDDAGEQVAANIFINGYGIRATGSFQIPALQTPGNYRVRVVSDYTQPTQPCHSVSGEAEDYTLIIEASCAINTWTSAAANGNWNDAGNWCSGVVPTAATNAKIPAANTPYPALTADASVNNLKIESGATVSIGAHTLTLNGTYNETTYGAGGTISGSDQSNLVSLNQSGTYIYFTPGQNLLKNLTLGYSAQLFIYSGDLEIAASPEPGTVTLADYSNFYCSKLVFKSGANGTARLAEVPVDGSGNSLVQIYGQQTVERYIPDNLTRAWRLLAVPTHGSNQTFRQAWQEGDVNPNPLDNNLPGYGTQITGPGSLANVTANGFDNISLRSSLLKYDGIAWEPVDNTNTAMETSGGYFMYIRGDRTKGISGAVDNSNATTLRTTGNLYQGDITSPILPANAYSVLGNPFASAIDFAKTTRTGGVGNVFYIWDAKKISGKSLGFYQTFSTANNFNCLVDGGSYVLGTPNTVIQSGQAFFVENSASTGTLTFPESSKIVISNSNTGFRPATPTDALVKLDSRLYAVSDNTTSMVDANTVVFSSAYSNAIDGDDASKLVNPGENFAIQKNGKAIAIEARQPINSNDTIFFNMWNIRQQQYQFVFVPGNLNTTGLVAELEDTYLHTSTPVSLAVNTTVSFTTDANAASSASSRFRIVFAQANPLSVSFISIIATQQNSVIKVAWNVADESGILNYEIEHSGDGVNFRNAGTVTATGNQHRDVSYNWLDANPSTGTNFYRIKSTARNGEIKYSSIVKIAGGKVKPAISIAPNPVEGAVVNLQLKNQPEGRYGIRMLTNIGQVIMSSKIQHAGGNSTQLLNLPTGIASGSYQVEVTLPDNSKQVQTLFINYKK